MSNYWKYPPKPQQKPCTSWGLVSLFLAMVAVIGWMFFAKALPQAQHDWTVSQEMGQ